MPQAMRHQPSTRLLLLASL